MHHWRMKLLSFLLLSSLASFAASPEVATYRLSSSEVAKWTLPSSVGPADWRPIYGVWVRSEDQSIKAFRITLRYRTGATNHTEVHVVENNAANGQAYWFRLPEDSTAVTGLVVGALREQETTELPVN